MSPTQLWVFFAVDIVAEMRELRVIVLAMVRQRPVNPAIRVEDVVAYLLRPLNAVDRIANVLKANVQLYNVQMYMKRMV